MKKITLFLVFISYVSFAQEYTYIDFGINSQETAGNWNNVSVANAADADAIAVNLIDFTGTATNVTLTINDAFDTVNTGGTTVPNASLPFLETATRDSFFGETSTFSGSLEPTGGFILTGLDPLKYYSFSIFASRNGVNDNREAQYTLAGSTTEVVALNASNNTADTVEVLNLQPNASGEITLVAAPGPNNTNGSGFYYLGAIEMITSGIPLSVSSFKLKNLLSVYPNPANDIFDVRMDIHDINGRLVVNIFDGKQTAGDFQFQWKRAESNVKVSTGIYFLKINVNGSSETVKLVLQ
jgi:hypothetical protein